MKTYEYFDLGNDVFMKVREDGNVVESLKKPKNEWPNVVINRFNGQKSYTITEEEQNEDMETVSALSESGEKTVSYPNVDELANEIVTDNDKHFEDVKTPESKEDTTVLEYQNDNVKVTASSYGVSISASDPNVKISEDEMPLTNEAFEPVKVETNGILLKGEVLEEKNSKPKAKTKKKADDFLTAVKKPSHYQGIVISGVNGKMEFEAIEIIDSIVNMLNLNPAASHAVGDGLKYILRCGKKDSDNNTTTDLMNKAKQDLLKSGWYLERASKVL